MSSTLSAAARSGRRQLRARGRCRPRPDDRARADDGGGFRRSAGSARRRRSRDRGSPAATPQIERISSGRSSASKPRLRASIPTATGAVRHSPPPWTKASSRSAGRLSTTSQPMSSSASRTVDLPAPDMPVTSSRRGGRRAAVVIRTSGPFGRARARLWTAPTRSSRRCVTSGSLTPRIGRSRLSSGRRWMSLVSSTMQRDRDVVDTLHSTMPMPRISSLPAMFGGARGKQAVAVALDDRLVVADEREAAVEQAQRKVRLARARRAGDQHRAAVDGDGAGMERFGRQPRAGSASAGSFAVRCRKPDGEAGAGRRVIAVVHVNLPVVAFDDCLGDGKAEAGMAAEILAFRPY